MKGMMAKVEQKVEMLASGSDDGRPSAMDSQMIESCSYWFMLSERLARNVCDARVVASSCCNTLMTKDPSCFDMLRNVIQDMYQPKRVNYRI
jgi:hypothetical protein